MQTRYRFLLIGLLLSVILAVFLAPFASQSPDGLEKVAEEKGFLEKTQEFWSRSPIPDYAAPGVQHEGLATAMAGLIGVLAVFAISYGLAKLLRRSPSRTS